MKLSIQNSKLWRGRGFLSAISFAILALIAVTTSYIFGIGSISAAKLTLVIIAAVLLLLVLFSFLVGSDFMIQQSWIFNKKGIHNYESIALLGAVVSIVLSVLWGNIQLVISIPSFIAVLALSSGAFEGTAVDSERKSSDEENQNIPKEILTLQEADDEERTIVRKDFMWTSRLDYLPNNGEDSGDISISIEISRLTYENYVATSESLAVEDPKSVVAKVLNPRVSSVDIKNFAKELKAISVKRGWPQYRQIHLVFSFVKQCIAEDIAIDPVKECRFPIQTLFEEKGSNLDKCILTISILREMGQNVCLLSHANEFFVGIEAHASIIEFSKNHLVASKYYLGSVNNDSIRLGEIQEGVDPKKIEVVQAD